jgi:hypothetical protein
MQTEKEILKGYEGEYKNIYGSQCSQDWKSFDFNAKKGRWNVIVKDWLESKWL